jgi:aminoglycoside phosphotransferase (APT) family kinase protein
VTPGVLVPRAVEAALGSDPAVGPLSRLRPTIGGFSNLTFYADLASGQTVVVKIASREVKREDLRREVRMLELLIGSGLRTPNVRAHIVTEAWTITVTDAIVGDLGLNVVQTRDIVDLSARSSLLAQLLQAVHAAGPQPVADGDLDRDLDCGARMTARLGELSGQRRASLPPEVVESVQSLADPLLRRGAALVHGDFGFHNTIWSTTNDGQMSIRALLDWEWSGWGNPLIDPAWLWWTLQFRQAPHQTWDAFVTTYGGSALRGLRWTPGNVMTVLRAQMAWILSCTEAGSPAEKEWCSRILKLESLRPPVL